MKKCCGGKAFIKNIKVGNDEIPIVGLEPIMFLVYNLELKNDDEILKALITEIEEMKNEIPSENRIEFNSVLMNEYKLFAEKFDLNRKKRIKV